VRLLIIGARQHAKVVAAVALEALGESCSVVGFLDDDPSLAGTRLLDAPILGSIKELEKVAEELMVDAALVGISNRYMQLRDEVFRMIQRAGLQTPSVIHPTAFISPRAMVGQGTVINPGVVVNAYAQIGSNCVIYSNSVIEHETRLEDNVYVGPGVCFSSNARVGRNAFLGAGVSVIPDIRIGTNSVVGAGSVVISDIPDNVTYAGVPARFINHRERTRF